MRPKTTLTLALTSATVLALASCKDSSPKEEAQEEISSAAAEVQKAAQDGSEDVVEELTDAVEEIEEATTEMVEDVADEADAETSAVAMAAAEKMLDESVAITEKYTVLMESIKDEESARAALAEFDALGEMYVSLGKKGQAMNAGAMDAEQSMELQKMAMQKMQPLQERMQKASMDSMQVFAANPELMQEFQKKSMELAEKMQSMMAPQ